MLNLRHGAGVINQGWLLSVYQAEKYNFILMIMKVFEKMCILKRSRACVENDQENMRLRCRLQAAAVIKHGINEDGKKG